MGVFYKEIVVETKGEVDMVDITSDIKDVVRESKLKNGLVCVFVPGSTGAVTTIEYEPGLMKDFPRALEGIAPKKDHYDHHETWHDDNGHSHVRASLLGPSLTLPFQDGQVIHGTWQQVVFVELDTRSRNRRLCCQVIGE
jgi:secondary thiamine-phosphate synthase enzyme